MSDHTNAVKSLSCSPHANRWQLYIFPPPASWRADDCRRSVVKDGQLWAKRYFIFASLHCW